MSYPAWMTFPCFKSEGDSFFLSSHHVPFLMSSVGMQIDRRISFRHMTRGFPVRKQYGRTGSIVGTAHCHRIFGRRWKNSVKSTFGILDCYSPFYILTLVDIRRSFTYYLDPKNAGVLIVHC